MIIGIAFVIAGLGIFAVGLPMLFIYGNDFVKALNAYAEDQK